MNSPQHYQTAPQDKIKLSHKLAYGSGAFVNNLLAAASGSMMIVLNLGLGMNPALVGIVTGFLPRLVDAFTDPMVGYISDNTNTRWGRRRPFIFVGAIAAALFLLMLWQIPEGKSDNFYFIWFLIGTIIFFFGYTIFATPWVALGYELTPDYHERTRLMGSANFIGQLAYVATPWFLWIMNSGKIFSNAAGEPDQVAGASGLAIVIAAVTIGLGILPAIFLRERGQLIVKTETPGMRKGITQNLKEFFHAFGVTLSSSPFLKLCLATFLVFNSFILISAFQSYVIIFYVAEGNEVEGAKLVGLAGSFGTICTFAVVAFITWLGTRIGKRHAFFLGIGLSILGYGLKWFCYNPEIPLLVLLPAPLMAFGMGTLFTLVPSMVADVVDNDELKTHERREGMYGSVFWFMVKLGMSLALLGGGYLLNATGFDVALGGDQTERTITLLRFFDAGIPMIASAIAIWAVASFPITEESAYRVRLELEKRRGKA